MDTIFTTMRKYRLIPVIKIEKPENIIPLAEALLGAGLPLAEITFRTDAAAQAIKIISNRFPQILTGAGTVLTTDQVDRALDAGAAFIVSPGFNPTVVDHTLKKNAVMIPGVNSPTQVEMGLERKLSVLKFFPAEATGGISFIKAMAAPYTQVEYIPTGGINAANFRSYLELPQVLACGGSWVVKSSLIESGNYQQITALCSQALAVVRELERDNTGKK